MSSRFERLQRTIGLAIDRVETPALLLDLDAFDRNNKLMNSLCAERHVSWRAHAKAHKSSFLARKQVEAGAVGVCVQKLGEAESLCAGGITDIYVSNEIVCEEKLERLALLAGEHPKVEFSIAVDSMFGLQRLVAALRKNKTKRVVGVLIDFNVGHNRCGCTVDDGIVIARALKECADVVFFKGIHCYHGSIQHEREASERFAKATAVSEQAAKIRDLMQSVTGVASMVVTGGGTGTLATDLALGVFTEVQPGSFAFMDVDYGKTSKRKCGRTACFSKAKSCPARLLTVFVMLATRHIRSMQVSDRFPSAIPT
jgi:D-serine deaminase-like pyridoxal phosphate-dependent protein